MENLNLDAAEIGKFDALSGEWWDARGKLKTLHALNPARLAYIKQRIELAGKSVLDVGCGGGLLSEAMAAERARVTGLDASRTAIEVAKAHQRNTADNPDKQNSPPVAYHHGTAEKFAAEHRARFEVITCMELLEHVPDPAALIACCAGMLRPQGHLFLSTLNRNLKSYMTAILAAEYLLRLLPKGTHDYKNFIRPAELCAWLRQAGFEVVDISGMAYIPGLEQCTLISDPAVNYLLYARLKNKAKA